jgi:4-hydroxybenzoate polyprenyltransferase
MAHPPSDQAVPSARKSSPLSGPAVWFAELRALDWLKNVFVLAPLLFSGHLLSPGMIVDALIGFALFCVLSSASYIFNDLFDLEGDRHHPAKASRPLVSGRISVSQAKIALGALLSAGLVGAFVFNPRFGLVAVVFVLLHVAYTLRLKDWVLVDVLIISFGFVLRILAGATVVNVMPSAWIILCTVLLSLFLGFSKRRQELVLLGPSAGTHRRVLRHYSLPLLDQMISAVLAATIVSYALYTVNNGPYQVYSVFFVLYGMLRYLYLVHRHGQGERPAESFFTDLSLLITVVCWTLFMYWDIYLS